MYKNILILLIGFFLISCTGVVNPPQIQPYLNRPYLTPSEITIVRWESSGLRPSETYLRYGRITILKNSNKVLGFIPKKTHFFIKQLEDSTLTIEITSGEYQGRSFIIFGDDANLLLKDTLHLKYIKKKLVSYHEDFPFVNRQYEEKWVEVNPITGF